MKTVHFSELNNAYIAVLFDTYHEELNQPIFLLENLYILL